MQKVQQRGTYWPMCSVHCALYRDGVLPVLQPGTYTYCANAPEEEEEQEAAETRESLLFAFAVVFLFAFRERGVRVGEGSPMDCFVETQLLGCWYVRTYMLHISGYIHEPPPTG